MYDLWLLLTSLGPNCGMKEFMELLKQDNVLQKSQVTMLMLFCDSMTHYVTYVKYELKLQEFKYIICACMFSSILDEYEMYTEQKPFLLNDFIMLTYFLNNILYKLINENLLGKYSIIIFFFNFS